MELTLRQLSGFHNLPNEVLVNVLARLPLRCIHACQLVCRRFDGIVKTSLLLQYIIELEAAGLQDGSPGPLTTAQRMGMLQQRQHKWRTLGWSRKDFVPYNTQGCLTYELNGRVFGQGKGDKGGATTNYISICELPSSHLMAPRRYIIDREQLGIPVWDFTVDPTQDLLILIEQRPETAPVPWRVHFRAFSTSQPHAEARAEVVEPLLHSSHCDWAESEFSIKVFESFVAILFKPMVDGGLDHILVWDWKTGRGCQPLVATGNFMDFAILAHGHVLAVTLANDKITLDVHVFNVSSDRKAPEDRSRRQTRKTRHAVTLELPEPTYSDWWNYSVTCLSNCTSRDFNVPAEQRAFRNSPDHHILAFCFTGHPHRASLIVQAKTLLRYAVLRLGGPAATVPWEEWGNNQSTRWITECCDRDWLCGTHSTRFVTLIPSPHGERPVHHRVQVLDFNPFEVRRWPEFQTPWSSTRIISDRTVLAAGGLWKHEVGGSLPYREVTLLEPMALSGVMIDECGIVCVKSEGHNAGESSSLEILTL